MVWWVLAALARPVDAGPRHIVGGEVERGFPAALALSDGSFLCTASLIAPQVALTAAHCVEGVYAASGELTLFDDANEPLTWVVDLAVHPSFDRYETGDRAFSSADIAVLRLMYPLSLEPVPFLAGPLPEEDDGAETWAVGFGRDGEDASASAGVKRSGTVDLNLVLGDTLLAFTEPGTTQICSGDSGGPLYHIGPEGPVQWGVAARSDCETASTWVRTDVYADWIDEASRRLGRRSGDCSHTPQAAWPALLLLALWRRRAAATLAVAGCTTPCGAIDRTIQARYAECGLELGERAVITGPRWCDEGSRAQAACLAACWEQVPCAAIGSSQDFSLSSCQIDCFGGADTAF